MECFYYNQAKYMICLGAFLCIFLLMLVVGFVIYRQRRQQRLESECLREKQENNSGHHNSGHLNNMIENDDEAAEDAQVFSYPSK